VRARRAIAREHLPSYREPASRDPQADQASPFTMSASPRTVSPSLGSCPASGGAASFLLASALFFPPETLAESPVDKTRDASDRLLPPERSTCTRTSCVPGSLRGFHRVDIPRSLGLRAIDRGTECFTALVNASAGRSQTHAACLASRSRSPCPVRDNQSVGVLFPRRLLPTKPLTPLSPLPLPRTCGSAFALPSSARLELLRAVAFALFFRVRKPPRSP